MSYEFAPIPGSFYVRTWYRLHSSTDTGVPLPIHLSHRFGVGNQAVFDLVVNNPGAQLAVGGFDSSATYLYNALSFSLVVDRTRAARLARTD